MPSLELNIDRLEKLVRKELDFEQLQYDLQWIGLDVDDFNKEENTIKVEYNANRPDFSSPEGIARGLRGYYEIELGLLKYKVNEGNEVIHVNPKVRKVRPFIVGGIVRDINFNEEQIATLMNIQEALHWALGRDRKKVAIGIHDYDQVKGPYKYTTVKPDGVRFRPLHLEAYEMTPEEILEEHEMGIRYAHILKGAEEYPIIYDAEGKVVSFPPIINGTYTTVTEKTKNLLLDLTGTSFQAVNYSINIISATFADMGAKLENVKIIYDDEPEKAFKTPNLEPTEWKVHIDYINSYIGLKLTSDEMIKCFNKVRLGASKIKDDNILKIKIPAYRTDFIHEVDFAEEVAVGFGYQNLSIQIKQGGFGSYHPILKFKDKSRLVMIGSSCLEMFNTILTSRENFKKLRLEFKEKEHIIIANPVSKEYNTTRRLLISGLMKNLQFNRSTEKPFRLFEIGDVILIDKTRDTNAKRELHLAAIVHSDSSDYSEIKTILDHYLRTIGVLDDIKIKAVNNPTFIEGRSGEIIYNNKKIGKIGEFYPQVILNFGLEYPTAGFEINLMPFISEKK